MNIRPRLHRPRDARAEKANTPHLSLMTSPSPSPKLQCAYPPLMLALEQRIMLDGAALVTAVDVAADAADADAANQQHADAAEQAQQDAKAIADAAKDFVPPAERRGDSTADEQLVIDKPAPRQIVFIDAAIAENDVATLSAAIDPSAEVILLESDRDGLTQIAEALEGRSGIDGIHIVSHGDDGRVQLGDSIVDGSNLDRYATTLASIGGALSADGDILFYGCNLGESETGLAFLDRVAKLTDADVAASDDVTGATDRGGNWDLEIQRGDIETDRPFSPVALADFSSVLAISGSPPGGTIDFTSATQSGSFLGGAGVDASYTSGGYTFVFDGTNESTYIGAGNYMNTSNGEITVAISIQSGATFNISSIDIQNQAGGGNNRSFTISSNIGGNVASGSLADSIFSTVALSGPNFTGITTLYVTVNIASYFAINNIVVSNIAPPVVNNAPTVTGLPNDVTVTEDAASNLDLSAATFADTDGDNLTVTLTASAGTMTASTGGGVTVGGSGTGTLTLAGTAANINTYLDTVSNIQYTGAANASGNDAATLTVNVNDGTVNPQLGTVNLDITAVNDPPTVIGLPTDVTVTEDAASNVDLSAATFADVDGDNLTVTLTASAGTLAASTGSGVTVGGSGTGTLTLAGTAANINTYLDTVSNIQYTGAANASGNDAATLTINVNDGTVNPQLGIVNLDITAVNDPPTVTGLPTDVTVTEDTASNLDLSAATFADVDGDSLTVTLAASSGILAASTGGGVTVGGSGTGTLTLAGTAANINTYLDTVSNIQYTGAANASGNDAATLTVNVNDGTVNPQLGTVNLDITAVNDPPTVTGLPTDVTVTEDAASNLDLSAATFADVDGDSLTVTLAASSGILAASTGSGVTVGGSGTGTLTLAGTAANINTYLDTVSNIQYTGAANASGNDAATLTINVNDGTVNPQLGIVNLDITAVNDAPVLANLDATPGFTEGGSAVQLDADVTVSDIDLDALNGGNGDFSGASLTIARNGGANGDDRFSVVSGGSLTVAGGPAGGGTITAGGNVIATIANTGNGQIQITFANNGTIPTTALVNEVLQAIQYQNASNTPPTTVQLDWTFSDGNAANAQGTGANPGQDTVSQTVNITTVNDAPTVTATGTDPTFNEGGGAQSLFNTAAVSTIESGQTIIAMTLTVTNVSDGADEILGFDGSNLALTNGNNITTAANGLSVSVSLSGSTATVSFSGATLSAAQLQTLIDGLTYDNTADVPSTSANRVVTITSATDSGGTTNGGDNQATLSVASTVTLTATNDAPTLSNFGPDAGNVGFTTGSATFVALDSGTAADAADAELDALNGGNGNYNGATITLVRNGGANVVDRFGLAGGTTALDNGNTVTVSSTAIGTVTGGSAAAGTITITLNANATSALVDSFFQSIGYLNTDGAAAGTATIDVSLNDGNAGSQGSGGASSVTQQVTIGFSNAPVIAVANTTLTVTEGAAPSQIDATATLNDPDGNADWNGGTLRIQVTANADAGDEISIPDNVVGTINTSGTNILNGATVIGTLSASEGTVTGGTALTITFNANATNALVQDVLRAISFHTTSDDPGTTNRTVTFTATDTNGVNAAETRSVGVTTVNDAPTLTATGSNPAFTEGGAGAGLFSGASIDTIEAGQNLTQLVLTVTNVNDDALESLNIDGTTVSLANGTSLTTSGGNGLGVSVSAAGATRTVTITSAGMSAANLQTVINGMSYSNSSNTPDASNRVVTLTSVSDNGGTANGGADQTALNIASTVTVSPTNDAPVLSGVDSATFTAGTPVAVLAGVTVADSELDAINGGAGTYNGATLTISRAGGANADDQFSGTGSLQGGSSSAMLGQGGTFSVSGTTIGTVTTNTGGTLVLTFNANATSALVNQAVQLIGFDTQSSPLPSPFELSLTFNDGQGGGANTDTATLALTPPSTNENPGGDLNNDQINQDNNDASGDDGDTEDPFDPIALGPSGPDLGTVDQTDIEAENSNAVGEVKNAVQQANDVGNKTEGPVFQVEAKVIGTVNDGVVSARNTSGGGGGHGQTVQTMTSVSDAVVDAKGESGNTSQRTASETAELDLDGIPPDGPIDTPPPETPDDTPTPPPSNEGQNDAAPETPSDGDFAPEPADSALSPSEQPYSVKGENDTTADEHIGATVGLDKQLANAAARFEQERIALLTTFN